MVTDSSEHEGVTIFPWWMQEGERVQKGFSGDVSISEVLLARWTNKKESAGNKHIKEWTAQPVLRIACGSWG